MWSQLIFFAAVALLIILLFRRVAVAKQLLVNLGQWSIVAGNAITKLAQSAVRAVRGLTSGRASTTKSESGTFLRSSVNDHQFWQESATPENLDLDSNYEEGEAHYKKGELEKAEKFYLKAAASHPGDAKIYARLGLLYLQQKNYSDAIESLKVAVKLDKYNPSRHYNLALAYTGNKDVQKAISSVREAITLDPVTQKYRQLLEQLLNS